MQTRLLNCFQYVQAPSFLEGYMITGLSVTANFKVPLPPASTCLFINIDLMYIPVKVISLYCLINRDNNGKANAGAKSPSQMNNVIAVVCHAQGQLF